MPHISEKMIIASILVGIVVIAPISMWVYVDNQAEKAKQDLENAQFMIYDVDILNISNGQIFFNITGEVKNLNTTRSEVFTIESFQLILDPNASRPVVIPVDTNAISTVMDNMSFSFVSSIEIKDLENSDSPFLGNLISSGMFDIPFLGRISAKANGIRKSIEFDNVLHFYLSRGIVMNVTEISNPISSKSVDTNVTIMISNQFSADFDITGIVKVNMGELVLGNIDLTNPLTLESGSKEYKLPLKLERSYKESLQSLITSENFTFVVEGEITVVNENAEIPAEIQLKVETGEGLTPLGWQVDNFVINDYDPFSGNGTVVFNITIFNNLPITIPINFLEMNLATLTNINFATVFWDGKATYIPKYSYEKLFNVTGFLKGVNAILLGKITQDKAIKVPKAIIRIFTQLDEFDLVFSIDHIDL